jgi:hypothetical protein
MTSWVVTGGGRGQRRVVPIDGGRSAVGRDPEERSP